MKKLKILYEDKDLLVVRKDDKVLTVSDGKIIILCIVRFMIICIRKIKKFL